MNQLARLFLLSITLLGGCSARETTEETGSSESGMNERSPFNQQVMDQRIYEEDMRQAQETQRRIQEELRRADQQDRENVRRLLESINDITFGTSARMRSLRDAGADADADGGTDD